MLRARGPCVGPLGPRRPPCLRPCQRAHDAAPPLLCLASGGSPCLLPSHRPRWGPQAQSRVPRAPAWTHWARSGPQACKCASAHDAAPPCSAWRWRAPFCLLPSHQPRRGPSAPNRGLAHSHSAVLSPGLGAPTQAPGSIGRHEGAPRPPTRCRCSARVSHTVRCAAASLLSALQSPSPYTILLVQRSS